MELKKGDRVKFLNDTGGGVITGFRDKKTVMVLIEEGFEVPVPVKEIICETPAGEYTNEVNPGQSGSEEDLAGWTDEGETEAETEEETDIDPEEPAGSEPETKDIECSLFTGVIKSHDKDREVDLYLINDGNWRLFYTFLIKQEEGYLNTKTGMLEEETKIFIRSFTREEINESPAIKIQAIFYRKGIYNPLSPVQREINLDPAEIYTADNYTVNDYFEENAFIIPVYSDFYEKAAAGLSHEKINRLLAEKEDISDTTGKKSTKKTESDPKEVDLHIEELVEDHRGMSNSEILETQMARFTAELEEAVRSNKRRIVFIHGVGNGKLRFKIRHELDRKYPRLKYQDASFREYGYGATMVILRK